MESGNKLSWDEWQESIIRDYPSAPTGVVRNKIIPGIKRLCGLSLAAAAQKVRDPIPPPPVSLLAIPRTHT
jgi:hypothetical protein